MTATGVSVLLLLLLSVKYCWWCDALSTDGLGEEVERVTEAGVAGGPVGIEKKDSEISYGATDGVNDDGVVVNKRVIVKRHATEMDEDDEGFEEDYAAFLGGSLGGAGKTEREHHRHGGPGHQGAEGGGGGGGPKVWDHWGKWSACSVSCGVGKITRWRHCVSGGCAPGEKEAQIKTCTLPAC